jgi:hypothetical protein
VNAVSHHYNPQVYLKQFKDPKSKNLLWEYDLKKGTARESTPKLSGCEDYYNSVALKDGGHDDDTIEQSFFALENALAKFFDTVRCGSSPGRVAQQTLCPELWDVFFAFAATQEARSPQLVSTIHNFLSDLHQFSFEIAKHSPSFQQALSKSGIDPEQVKIANVKVEAAKGSALLLSLEGIETAVQRFRQMGWTFFVAQPSKFFFTSERPVCLWLPPDERSVFGIGLANKDIQITFPLSRRVCAYGRWRKAKHLYEAVPNELVDAVNDRSIWNARHFVYGPALDNRILESVKAKAERGNQAASESHV